MYKKYILILLIILPFFVRGQLAVGDWNIYSAFSGSFDKIVETPEKVYYQSGTNIFSYDKENNETYSYSSRNLLNDNNVTNIYYNKHNKYLLITYETGNIDLLYDDGRIVNIPDIKDAVLTSKKTINDIAFDNCRIYVATAFGLVIIDDQKYEVVESGIYNKNIACIESIDNYILLYYNYTIYTSNKNIRHNTFESFKSICGAYCFDIKTINKNNILVKLNDGINYILRLMTLDLENNIRTNVQDLSFNNSDDFYECKDCIYTYNNESILFIDSELNIKTNKLPTELYGNKISTWSGLNSVWAGNSLGLGNYDISDGGITLLQDRFFPSNITVNSVYYLKYGKSSGKIYFSNTGDSNYNGYTSKWSSTVNTVENGIVENVSADSISYSNASSPNYKNSNSTILYDPYDLVEDPTDPDCYYIGSFWEGVFKINKNRKEVVRYSTENSSFTKIDDYAVVCSDVDIDSKGNLWVLQYRTDNIVLHMLPSEKRQKNQTEISDWYPIKINGFTGYKDGRMLICEKSNMIFLIDDQYNTKLVAYDTKGTTDVSDDEYLLWNKYIDQDGKEFAAEHIMSMVEDHKGRVWLGTSTGVIEITNPSEAINSNMTINRLKVPHNDGTSLADYLLDSQSVKSMSVDNSNRKWLGTLDSGLYLVSEDGDEILEHFTTSNSYLPSDKILALACDKKSNSVFIGTEYGLVEYSSTSAPAMDDYSEVYAYPNPVRPDYTGWITIKGLMDNSLVKIADAAGNVFYTTQSEGGMVTWDGCNADGQRVKTGVYFVYASQNNGNENSGVVTKILVIN